MTVIVVPHDPAWPQHFDMESRRIAERLGGIVYRLHHIGSTAIPGIAAKPIIDMLMEVAYLGALDSATADFEALGYESMGEYGIPGRRYFRRNDSHGRRTHHLHAFRLGTDDAQRHLALGIVGSEPERVQGVCPSSM